MHNKFWGFHAWLLFRMVFPTIQQNQSPLAIVPAFLDCLAKKMEHASKEQDYKFLKMVILLLGILIQGSQNIVMALLVHSCFWDMDFKTVAVCRKSYLAKSSPKLLRFSDWNVRHFETYIDLIDWKRLGDWITIVSQTLIDIYIYIACDCKDGYADREHC